MSIAVGTPAWIDFATLDSQKSHAFYSGLLSWEFESMGDEFGGYELVRNDGELVGGFMDVSGMDPVMMGGEQPKPEWGLFLAVDNLDARTEKAKAAVAEVLVDTQVVGDSGSFRVLRDPAGASVSLWQPDQLDSFDRSERPGAAVWFELVTNDFDRSVAFYRDVLDFDIHEMPPVPGMDEFRYATNGAEANATSGICGAPWLGAEGTPYWRIYFAVDGADAAAAKVAELGGRITDGPQDSPYGRVMTAVDPEGVTFQLTSMAEATPMDTP
ncbi:VOC family protein [Dietzia sp.]|uniref:VOC family protein n=1 Tax=Dietzia sp. TaxID=1871616 RepID=UPI002FD9015F